MRLLFLALAATLLTGTASGSETPISSYAGQELRTIKALSNDEVEGLLAGKGLGFAKSAELNDYPGPAHVIELASQLGLSKKQQEATQAIHQRMQTRARSLGEQLVREESQLEQLFRQGNASLSELDRILETISNLQAELRGAHLAAHIEQRHVLTTAQVVQYTHLRGYGAHQTGGHHRH